MKKNVALLAALLLSGCIPRYATVRPALDVQVKNDQNEPVADATMWLLTQRMPPGYYPPAEKFSSDAQGRIRVERKSQWETLIFFLHGVNFYSWRWCIEAPGYHFVEGENDRFSEAVILQRAATPSRCPDALRQSGEVTSGQR